MRHSLAVALLVGALAAPAAPQNTAPSGGESLPEALEAIARARIATRILYVTAHPDDEAGSLLPYLARGLGADVALLTLTRGEGGQNAIGPELGPQLAAIRSAELLAATRVYGVRLYFTRAPDFGFSKTLDESLRIWGDQVLDDIVRVIRTFRPHVIINGWGGIRGGHGNHQASGYLTPKAYEAAADPKAFPQQLAEGLAPWRASLLLQPVRGEGATGWAVPAEQISPVWGVSYREIGFEALLHHRSQGVAGFLGSPLARRQYVLARAEGGAFDPAELARPLANALPAHRESIQAADGSLAAAWDAALRLDWPAAVKALAAAGRGMAQVQEALAAQAGSSEAQWRDELARVRARIDAALAEAAALRIEAQADHSEVVAGESFTVRVKLRFRMNALTQVAKPSLVLPTGWNITKEETEAASEMRFAVAIPADARPPQTPNEWMLPEPPPLLRARVRAGVEGYAFDAEAPVVAWRVTSTRFDVLPVSLAPAVTLALEPRQFIVPLGRPAKPLELLLRVHYYGTEPTELPVGITLPVATRFAGRIRPTVQTLEFLGPGDQLVRFTVTPAAGLPAGTHELHAWAELRGTTFTTSLEPLPSLPARLWSEPAVVKVRAFDLAVPDALHVGYVAAENDPIPEALRQLGIHVELLDSVALAFGDLSRYDAIVIGIRAYELRDDLARTSPRLLDYVREGGTLVVQYQRENVWNRLHPAPYPASIGQPPLRVTGERPGMLPGARASAAELPQQNLTGQPAVRITDENSPVRFLVPEHPVLTFPNKISLEDFRGWVQERGLYFWSTFDGHYQSLLALRDPGEEEVTGGLVYARYGKGVYIYTGLSFFRQLPEGVPGAYRLFINLLSQSKLPK